MWERVGVGVGGWILLLELFSRVGGLYAFCFIFVLSSSGNQIVLICGSLLGLIICRRGMTKGQFFIILQWLCG